MIDMVHIGDAIDYVNDSCINTYYIWLTRYENYDITIGRANYHHALLIF